MCRQGGSGSTEVAETSNRHVWDAPGRAYAAKVLNEWAGR